MTVAPEVIARYEQLKRLAEVASATSAGLSPGREHWRDQLQRAEQHFANAARGYAQRVVVEGGVAVGVQTVERATGNTSGVVRTWDERRTVIPELAGHAQQIQELRDQLAVAREQHEAAAARSGAYRRAVDEACTALVAAGWKESRL